MHEGEPVRLAIYGVSDYCIRVVLSPQSFAGEFGYAPALIDREYGPPILELEAIGSEVTRVHGSLQITVSSDPIQVQVHRQDGTMVQELTFTDQEGIAFMIDDKPIFGLGEGGPLPGDTMIWDSVLIEYDRRGRYFDMQPRWQRDIYGSRNPVPMLVGPGSYGLFVAHPWVEVDLSDQEQGRLLAWQIDALHAKPQTFSNQQEQWSKGKPPADSLTEGLIDLFVFDAREPAKFMQDVAGITGKAALPPKWALGYMQSHRTLESGQQMIDIVNTFRKKEIPLDAVIYLGTGFTPRGWNTHQPSFDFNREVFSQDPVDVIGQLHDRNVKVIMHMVPWDRDKLPYLHGSIPPQGQDSIASGHIAAYWKEHVELMQKGVDAWWPDEGDWFDLEERMKRHEMYYTGPVSTYGKRPWTLHRNGFLGISRWGGWIWSGDTDSRWKSLEAQIAVGLNHSISLSPFWGFDIGGFYPSEELTGELYIRWFQFGAFVPSFRAHGRTWWTRLPWGWGLDDLGPLESSTPPRASELGNMAIEPIAKKYTELRYRLLPYNYTLTWQAREEGLPMMRPLWFHYPSDSTSMHIADQYLWGHDILVAPVYTKGAKERSVYLPPGDWYDFWTDEEYEGGRVISREVDLETMPVYVRAGAIIPMDPIRQFTDQPTDEPMVVTIYAGADGDFTLYEDDGKSMEYQQGAYSTTHFHWDNAENQLSIRALETGFPASRTQNMSIRLMPQNVVREVAFNGEALEADLRQ